MVDLHVIWVIVRVEKSHLCEIEAAYHRPQSQVRVDVRWPYLACHRLDLRRRLGSPVCQGLL